MTSRRPRRIGLLLVATAVLTGTHLLGATPVQAQSLEEITATPEAAAELYLRSIRAIRWSAAAQFIDDETLERFHQTVSMITEADSSGAMADFLVQEARPAVSGLEAAEVFERAIGSMIDDMPGLMHAFFDRDDEVIGSVHEGQADAHAVYRTMARISGAVPEVKVMQMRRSPHGWRVVWSDELEVLDAALRGVTRGR